MNFSPAHYTKWVEILRTSKTPSGCQSILEELINVMSNPLYQFVYWEHKLIPDLANDNRKWPMRWVPYTNTWKAFEPSWFLAEAHPNFGFGFKWNNVQFDLYGDVNHKDQTMHPIDSEKTSVIAELEFSRINTFLKSGSVAEEPTCKYYFHTDRTQWINLLNVMTPSLEYTKAFELFRMIIQSPFMHVVPWVVPPRYNKTLNVWEGDQDIVLQPSPFLVAGTDTNSDPLTGLSYWWEQSKIKVYGGVQHRKRQVLRLIDSERIARIAVIKLTAVQQSMGLEPSLSPSHLIRIHQSNASIS